VIFVVGQYNASRRSASVARLGLLPHLIVCSGSGRLRLRPLSLLTMCKLLSIFKRNVSLPGLMVLVVVIGLASWFLRSGWPLAFLVLYHAVETFLAARENVQRQRLAKVRRNDKR
jgi:type IV secretory pathway VirB2 component (pilin)